MAAHKARSPSAIGDVLPDTATISVDGHLTVAGCDAVELASTFGTPLYVYDVATIRAHMAAIRGALAAGYPGRTLVCYAAKALCAPWLLRLVAEAGLGLDVVSGGELHAAVAVDFPRDRIHFHGNNKSEDELSIAVREGVGRIVVDNLEEIGLLGRIAAEREVRQAVLLRVSPGVDAHTHAHLTTGVTDAKFGLGIESGQAAIGVRAILETDSLDLRGVHAHIGSQVTELEPYAAAVSRLVAFARSMEETTAFRLREISPGGGYAVAYTPADEYEPAPGLVRQIAGIVAESAGRTGRGHPLPDLTIEPGRSIVAQAAVALYRVGSVKEIPGGRTYVAVDGGMADNIRPAAYGARYTALLANRAGETADAAFTIAGRYCETGDILVENAFLPRPRVGDIVAVPMAGAYQLSMASNYNMSLRPAVVVVSNGTARLVRRRETYADLLAAEVLETAGDD